MNRLDKREYAAYTIRPKIQCLLPEFLTPAPKVRVNRRYNLSTPKWHTDVTESNIPRLVAECGIDHSVRRPSDIAAGGARERRVWRTSCGRTSAVTHATGTSLRLTQLRT